MSGITIKVRRLDASVALPAYAHQDDAGMDLCSAEAITLPVRGRALVRTGIAIELPSSVEAQIRPRSGLAANHGVTVLNSPGTVDAGFRGEIRILLINLGDADFEIKIGMKIAQLVLARALRAEVKEVVALSVSDRGDGGFGSTGV